jgi:hypothetical protein
VASTALASWFDARREERQMEAEIDRFIYVYVDIELFFI